MSCLFPGNFDVGCGVGYCYLCVDRPLTSSDAHDAADARRETSCDRLDLGAKPCEFLVQLWHSRHALGSAELTLKTRRTSRICARHVLNGTTAHSGRRNSCPSGPRRDSSWLQLPAPIPAVLNPSVRNSNGMSDSTYDCLESREEKRLASSRPQLKLVLGREPI